MYFIRFFRLLRLHLRNYLRCSQVFLRKHFVYLMLYTDILLKLCIFNDTVNVFEYVFILFIIKCILMCMLHM